MNFIQIDMSGLLSLLVFFWSAVAFFVGGLVSVLVANFRSPARSGSVKNHAAFGFFAAAAVLMGLNLAGFLTMWYLVDAEALREWYKQLDDITIFVWMPLQFVVWVAGALIYNKIRK